MARKPNERAHFIYRQDKVQDSCHEHRGHLSGKGVLGNQVIPTYIGIPCQLSQDYPGQLPHKPNGQAAEGLSPSSQLASL